MRISTLSVSLALLAVCVSAASLQPLFAHRAPAISAASIGQALERRQVSVTSPSSVPAQCTSTCNPVNNEVSLVSVASHFSPVLTPRVGVTIPWLHSISGCPATACCTISFETEYYNCLECVGMALDTTNYATAQNSLNLLYTTCVDMGFVLPQLALPGEPASGSNSTSSAAVHVTSTGSASTASRSVAPSSSSTPQTGAAVSARWRGVQTEAAVGAAVLFGVAGLW
ncbi:hypothetical protein J3R82DRAFT_3880 [Butyriboletus roseoflavus]|nr:hypothetical protein J3R82DRAFT_3880 [Butyriboletus roseoflavus]